MSATKKTAPAAPTAPSSDAVVDLNLIPIPSRINKFEENNAALDALIPNKASAATIGAQSVPQARMALAMVQTLRFYTGQTLNTYADALGALDTPVSDAGQFITAVRAYGEARAMVTEAGKTQIEGLQHRLVVIAALLADPNAPAQAASVFRTSYVDKLHEMVQEWLVGEAPSQGVVGRNLDYVDAQFVAMGYERPRLGTDPVPVKAKVAQSASSVPSDDEVDPY